MTAGVMERKKSARHTFGYRGMCARSFTYETHENHIKFDKSFKRETSHLYESQRKNMRSMENAQADAKEKMQR